jgi:RNA polymerase sigma-70 factor, ECF subfamily
MSPGPKAGGIKMGPRRLSCGLYPGTRSDIRSSAGFTSRTYVDDSPEAQRVICLAVERAKAGDHEAFRLLYIRYSDNIYGYVRSIVRDDYESEDITQHVFAKLMTSIGKYNDQGVPFFSWLLRLARNVAIDHLRSMRETPCDEVVGSSEPSDEGPEAGITMREALSILPKDQREVVVLRHVVGLSPGEIAELMGKTESSIHGLHHRGRRALQQELTRQRMTPVTTPRELAAV